MTARCVCLTVVLTAVSMPPTDAAEPRDGAADRVTVEHSFRTQPSPAYRRGLAIQHHASTPAEALARGLAALIAARAEAHLTSAQARIAAAEAADHEMDNRKKRVRNDFEIRRINRESRAEERGPRPSQDDLARYAQVGKPQPLSPSELDAATGEVSWPVALQTGHYAELRAQLEEFFADRAAGVLDLLGTLKVHGVAEAMLAELSRHARQMPPADYIDAKRFVESLAYTARQPGD